MVFTAKPEGLNRLLWEVLQGLGYLWEQYNHYIMAGALITLGILTAIRFGIPAVIKRIRRGKMTRQQFKALGQLLKIPALVEKYAPPEQYRIPLAEGEKPPYKLAWLSPFPSAVKYTHKRNRVGKTQKFLGRQQILEASRSIEIKPITKAQANMADPETSYQVRLQLAGIGHSKAEIRKLEGKLRTQLKAYELQEVENENETGSITYLVATKPIEDPLIRAAIGKEFFEQCPAKEPTKMPLAMQANGQPYIYQLHHTLIWGATGSGKGSVMQALIRQVAPYVKDGRCKLYGIDPKGAELKIYTQSSMFHTIALGEYEEMVAVIEEVYEEMNRRKRINNVSLEKGEAGRSLKITQQTPLILLLIDELPSLLREMKDNGRDGRTIKSKLIAILNQGRSLQIYFIGATQAVEKELLEDIRSASGSKIVLRTSDGVYLNDYMLGERAAERGYDSNAIPVANQGNNYKSAGIGFAKDETGSIVKIRFPYLSDPDLAQFLLEEFPKDQEVSAGQSMDIGALMQGLDENRQSVSVGPGAYEDWDELPELDEW